MARRQPVAARDLGVAGLAAMQRPAFRKQLRPRRAMDGAIDATAAEQRRIGGVDDGVDIEFGDVAGDDAEPRGRRGCAHDPALAEREGTCLTNIPPHILNTPNFVSGIGALSAADSDSASTSRDLAGSMMPSSHSRADE